MNFLVDNNVSNWQFYKLHDFETFKEFEKHYCILQIIPWHWHKSDIIRQVKFLENTQQNMNTENKLEKKKIHVGPCFI